jgi:hypothetical protein
MDNDQKRVVWILGAGFSRSLGAPLLAELFTQESLLGVRATFGAIPEVDKWMDQAEKLVTAYLRGARSNRSPANRPEAHHWEHAEEFIERIALASECGGAHAERLHAATMEHISGRAEAMHSVAKSLLAAECSAFLEHADPAMERWSPYLTWATHLRPSDTVLTFNYDRVPDLLNDTIGLERAGIGGSEILPIGLGDGDGLRRAREQRPMSIPSPFELRRELSQGHPTAPARAMTPKVLKLHGSVDWLCVENGVPASTKPTFGKSYRIAALVCGPEFTAIATPGPEKRKLCRSGFLSPLWEVAKTAVENADAIVVVGYSFPPTDAMTRDNVMRWVRQNAEANWDPQQAAPRLVHTVLGPDTSSHDSRRIAGMFRAIDPNAHSKAELEHRVSVIQWPMWAEDFLALVSRDQILDPPRDLPAAPRH